MTRARDHTASRRVLDEADRHADPRGGVADAADVVGRSVRQCGDQGQPDGQHGSTETWAVCALAHDATTLAARNVSPGIARRSFHVIAIGLLPSWET